MLSVFGTYEVYSEPVSSQVSTIEACHVGKVRCRVALFTIGTLYSALCKAHHMNKSP